jgi:hypothetical protein
MNTGMEEQGCRNYFNMKEKEEMRERGMTIGETNETDGKAERREGDKDMKETEKRKKLFCIS